MDRLSRGFFLPVRVLSGVFRGKRLDFLKQEYEAGNLPMTGGLSAWADAGRFVRWLSALYQKDWVVYCEPPEDAGYRCPHCGQPALQLVTETGHPSVAFLVASTYRGHMVDST